MNSQHQCNEPFPGEGEIRCRQQKGHEGNHAAEAEKVDKNKKDWPKVRWEWNREKIVQQPGQQMEPRLIEWTDNHIIWGW